jgi:MFS family permease
MNGHSPFPAGGADRGGMTTTTVAPVPAPVLPSTARPGLVLFVLLVGQFMAILDVSIVNVAVPTIRTDLATSSAGLQLIVAGYTISYAVLLVTGARLGDRFGASRAYRSGLALFTLASLACGLAPTAGSLIAFRVVQGVGAAVMMPQIMSLIQRTFSGAARARALSLYAAVIACGAVVGQVVGGLLVSADLFGTGWRPVFLVNVPIGLALLVLARRGLTATGGDRARKMDPARRHVVGRGARTRAATRARA